MKSAREILASRGTAGNEATQNLISAVSLCTVPNVVRRLSKADVDVDGYDEDGEKTALLKSCFHVRPQVVGLLLKAGADPNKAVGAGLEEGRTPLIELASEADEHEADVILAIAFALIDAGANVNAQETTGACALHECLGTPRLVEFLLEKGADVNLKNDEGETPLACALRWLSEDGNDDPEAKEESRRDEETLDASGDLSPEQEELKGVFQGLFGAMEQATQEAGKAWKVQQPKLRDRQRIVPRDIKQGCG